MSSVNVYCLFVWLTSYLWLQWEWLDTSRYSQNSHSDSDASVNNAWEHRYYCVCSVTSNHNILNTWVNWLVSTLVILLLDTSEHSNLLMFCEHSPYLCELMENVFKLIHVALLQSVYTNSSKQCTFLLL